MLFYNYLHPETFLSESLLVHNFLQNTNLILFFLMAIISAVYVSFVLKLFGFFWGNSVRQEVLFILHIEIPVFYFLDFFTIWGENKIIVLLLCIILMLHDYFSLVVPTFE